VTLETTVRSARRHRAPQRFPWPGVVQFLLLLPPALFLVTTVPGVRPGGVGYRFWLDGVLNNLAYECAAVLCAVRTRRSTGSHLGGYLLAAGLALYGGGNVFWTAAVRPLVLQPFPSGADALFLAFYPLAFSALVLAAKRRDARHARSLWLDGIVGATGVAAIAAAATIGPILDAGQGSWAAIATTTAYPLLDLVLLLVVAATLSLYAWRPPKGIWLLGAGLVLFVVADMAYLFSTARGTYVPGRPTDGVWVVAVVLVALTPGWPAAPTGPRLPGWALVSVPVLATTGALGLLVTDHVHPFHPIAVVLGGLTVVLSLARLLITFRDVSALAESRELALTDELSGLGNRRALYRAAPQAISQLPDGAGVGLLLLDLDRFKEINDSLGHHAGDTMLRQVGVRLRSCVGERSEIVVRLGGDEFAVLLTGVDAAAARDIALEVTSALAEPLPLDGIPVRIGVSIGIALQSATEADLSSLLRQADVAMYHAKTHRLGTFAYSADVDEFASGDRLETVELLRDAIGTHGLVLHYQPKIATVTGDVEGVEALVRWQHPTRGLLYPDQFLPLVETAGLMEALTRTVLEQALDQASLWWRAGRVVPVAVNLSASSLVDRDLPDRIAAMLAARGVPPQLLVVEITEEFLMADRQRAQHILAGLRTRGVRIAVDDYGTGYSSLAYLRELPIDDLKLDKSFLVGMTGDDRALAIVRSTIMLAHSLGLRLVAEGVEDHDTCRELERAGCDVQQGWLHSKALPSQDFERWMDQRERVLVVAGRVPEVVA